MIKTALGLRGLSKSLFTALTDRGVIGSIIQTLSTSIFIQFINIATGIITAHALAPEGRGELAAVTMWPQFLAYTLTFGTPVSLIFCIRRDPEKSTRYFGASLLIGGVASVLAILAGVIGMPFWLKDYPPTVIAFAQIMMLAAPISSIGLLLTSVAQAEQRFALYNNFRILPFALSLVFLLGLYATHELTVIHVALAYLVAALPSFGWSALWVARVCRPSLRDLAGNLKTLLGFGIRAWGADLVGTISDQIDRVLVVAFLVPADMGFYVVALSSARLMSIIPAALQSALFPRLVTAGPGRGATLYLNTCIIVLLLTALAAVPLMLEAPFLLTLVYGRNFLPAAPIFRILLAEAVFGGATMMLAQGFSAFGRPGRSSIQQIIGLACAVPLMFFWLPRLGLTGAGLALLSSTLVRFGFAVASYMVIFRAKLAPFSWTLRDFRLLMSPQTE
jgi:O-antigen/teichoic acid export membrane protein